MKPECECQVPVRGIATANRPRAADYCCACHKKISHEWTSNDITVPRYYDRLEEATLGMWDGKPPTADRLALWDYRRQCEYRERTGRARFGLSFLGRDNVAEGLEEAADLSNYALFESLKALRAGQNDNIDAVLRVSEAGFLAHKRLREIPRKRAGEP